MNLASIHSEPSNAAAHLMIYGLIGEHWIGFNSIGANGSFVWSDSSIVTYTNWDGNQIPDNHEKCVSMLPSGKWRTLECNAKLPSICKANFGPVLTTPAQIEGLCPDPNQGNWIGHGSYCYLFPSSRSSDSEAESYNEAQQQCVRRGGREARLVTVHNVVEQAWITKEAIKLYGGDVFGDQINLWLGLSRRGPNSPFTWGDDSPLSFENWKEGEPISGNCAHMLIEKKEKITGFWKTMNCKKVRSVKFLCKAKKIPMPTTPIPLRGKCPEKLDSRDVWEIYGKKCFLFGKSHMVEFQVALRDCQKLGGSLAEIESHHENYFLEQKSRVHLPHFHEGAWVGLKKLNQSGYFWLSGKQPVFEYWHYKDERKMECVSLNLDKHGFWTSNRCTSQFIPYICQTDLILGKLKVYLIKQFHYDL